MGILIFMVIVLFVLGGWLFLLRTANSHTLPPNVKSQPYADDED
jgi:hypothetical protein